MPLLLFDLDNTLLPRDAAYRAWAQSLLSEHDLPPGDVDWFVTLDGGGYVPRSTVLSAVRRRYGLNVSADVLLAHYRRGINSHIHCPPRHVEALRSARAAGWTLGIVSNGGTRPQLEKIRRTGLGSLVDGWVISEEADCVKPDPLIFQMAARRCGIAPTGDWAEHTWMIGDHAPADIAGAELTGLRSVWLHHGRPWAESGYRPTLKAAGLPEAVGQVLAARNAPSPRPGVRSGGPLRKAAAGVPVRATALVGARSGAHRAVAAPDGPSASVPVTAGTVGEPVPADGPGVRNRPSGFAVIAEARPATGAGSRARAGGRPGPVTDGPRPAPAAAAVTAPTPATTTATATATATAGAVRPVPPTAGADGAAHARTVFGAVPTAASSTASAAPVAAAQ
ncbi:HAD-IA family hydrolase [Kitasatospora sp. NPDC101235]|uniref:HAD-IA family hydrolase n=1 Tax=Kitasatospora sp. NPDC101235 TaxID=3364101 RepID=UPI0037FB99D4